LEYQSIDLVSNINLQPEVTPLISQSCPANSYCVQKWSWTLLPTPLIRCTIDGDYYIHFYLKCQANQANCPLSSPTPITVHLSLLSENFCPTEVATVDLSAALAAYSTAARSASTSTSSFIVNSPAYFRLTTTSNAATIVSSQLLLASVLLPSSGYQTLYSGSTCTPCGQELSFLVPSSSACIVDFEFVLLGSYFTPPASSILTTAVKATVNVGFLGASSSFDASGTAFNTLA
jgi:hypothetical protein